MRDMNLISQTYIIRFLEKDLRLFALALAILVYGVWGSPTPDSVTWVEIAVGCLLFISVGTIGFLRAFKYKPDREKWFLCGSVLLIYGLIAGITGALIAGADVTAIVRDILPFGFMFLPLFWMTQNNSDVFVKVLIACFICLGLCFALRASSQIMNLPFNPGYDKLYYLGNSPAVLFSGLFLLGQGMERLARGLKINHVIFAGFCFSGSLLTLLPMIITSQRASLAAVLFYGIFLFGLFALKAPRRMIIIGSLGLIMTALFFDDLLFKILLDIQEKSDLVGSNMRFEEWRAVWSEISQNPLTILFGQGWGASFPSPAVADIEVTYTHGLMGYMFLKLGLVGFVLCGFYITSLMRLLLKEFPMQPVFSMALAAPLLIDTFLYAAFKSLDFGLLLAMIPACKILTNTK